MQLAAKNFMIFSGITFLLFGIFSKDNKYQDAYSYKGSAMFSLCGDSHITSSTGLSSLAMKTNGLSAPVVDTKLAERVSLSLKEEMSKTAPPAEAPIP